MVKAFVRTETNRYVRILMAEFYDSGAVEFKALSYTRLTWKEATNQSFLQRKPRHILKTLALNAILKDGVT